MFSVVLISFGNANDKGLKETDGTYTEVYCQHHWHSLWLLKYLFEEYERDLSYATNNDNNKLVYRNGNPTK